MDDLNIGFDEMKIGNGGDFVEHDLDSCESDSSEPEVDERILLFLEDHPLYETHYAEFDENKKNAVPKFIGGLLPRQDRGDREYYCTTMLTLFKPWRSGKNLKHDIQSWDGAFTDREFTRGQLEIMNNFNPRYECLDARDDFSARLRQGALVPDGMCPKFMTLDMMEDLDQDSLNNGNDVGDDHDALLGHKPK